MTDTIYAPATAAGRAAVAVVRVSGPWTRAAVRALAGAVPPPRRASLKTLRNADGEAIDQALVLFFAGPESYTGEDAAEFHVHGGTAVVGAVIEALRTLDLRLAEPGEFTRRAFEHGKLDLAQAEGVADLIDAETEAQRRQALEQLGGRLSDVQARWTEALLEALAMLEAAVDFPDEEVPQDVAARARPVLEHLVAELEIAAADAERGERIREGYRIALIGAPNAGKSTLLNALAGRDAAIVTATPGTTRDIIEVPMVLAGYKALMADTAGLRETGDEIEAEGVRRARAWAAAADLRLWLVDGSSGETGAVPMELRPGDLCLITKRDLPVGPAGAWAAGQAKRLSLAVAEVTAKGPGDLDWIRGVLEERIVEALEGAEPPAATRLRHQELLTEAADRLRHALAQDEHLELAAEDVRLAARALDRITGRIDPEQVLGRIFSTFCIGK
ncbi:MAG: tRNA uridine-5-carboxymethylaminomethyl(34) synthesis GTPase MnmE [Phenylobacterium sp. RIFCSPHIGHO2_01_FULL_69_31]|jgi:tRNA modification GTPase|uniref:tRNA uridine-5-carboxymethylaminomethyl(34) synthesis GTPase MnmE n=1 Tax=Phenylobacterium sp. RIFCSPHIGHO2_01_FULL_69_31 TaxID=1801944 RepID=UPI0008C8EF8D|nr:tRNA uridine-5-carboxymethylaminomethyl(34) synthesis GTPase MnmE [Phenylobacterium sp. RIFCSPHIGHO2_01_FULL_69_31]OHB29591.1 MAG: tRNA uridine-5-carboxymethylaminomethyl(34) synthesis GTPase MnmE [Phenylobacterium sp. RIFCSPHIGHO2_01_FULL_69_31]